MRMRVCKVCARALLCFIMKSCAPSIDGTSNIQQIADLFSSKFAGILNKHSSSPLNPLLSQIQSSLSSSMFQDLYFTNDDITEAIGQLKPKKSGQPLPNTLDSPTL